MTEFFSNIKDVLNGVEFRSLNPTYGKIIEDWDLIVGKKFAGKSEVGDFFKKGDKLVLVIYVKSSPILQELTFFKSNIIRKIKEKYNIELSDLIIKPAQKSFSQTVSLKPDILQETYDILPTDEELNNIILPEHALDEIRLSVQNQPTLSDEQKKRMLEVIVKDLKTQEWMKQKGFPICKKCGRVLTRKNFGEDALCPFCK